MMGKMDGWLIRKGYEYVGKRRREDKRMEYGRAGGKFQQGKDFNRGLKFNRGKNSNRGTNSNRAKDSSRGKDFNRAKRNPAGGCFWSREFNRD